jgi:protein phosphatase
VPAEAHLLQSKGVVLAVADGVSSAGEGGEASREAVKRFAEEYFQTPDTWSVARSGENILSTINLHLYRRSHEYTNDSKGFLSTFSAVVIKGRLAHCFHIGDSRIYHWRKSEALTCLTRDHARNVGEGQTFLTRAIGMDNHLPLDYSKTVLEEGDQLLLCSDGISDFVSEEELQDLLSRDDDPQTCSRNVLDAALQNGSDDNLGIVVTRLLSLADETMDDSSASQTLLPIPPELSPGMHLDGYLVLRELFASSRSQLYLVEDVDSGEQFAMKTPSRNFEDDKSYLERFVREEWVGLRIQSPHVVKVIRPVRDKSALYYLMEYVHGQGLDRWIADNQPPSPKKAFAIVKQVAAGLKVFHGNEAIHQDLKPANIMVCEDGRVLILDFGSVYVAGLEELRRPDAITGALGTAAYADPLYLRGENPGIAGDVYSLATICYEMFTGRLPYGDGVEECRSHSDYARLRYRHAADYNPVVPIWFDRALEKGVEFDLEQRYGTIDDLMADLSEPNPEFLREDPVTERGANQLMFWKLLSGFWFLLLIVLIYLFSQVAS